MNPDRSLRLATWNIHMAVGTDGRRDLGRVARVVRELDADLVGLQEVDNRIGSGGDDLQQLEEQTGMMVIAGPTMQRPEGDYGNALLTRWPVLRVERHDISVAGREPRGVLVAEIDWAGQKVTVAVTHMGLRPGERRHQARAVIRILSGYSTRPLLFMGDFNEWLFWGRPLRWLHRHFGVVRSPATFPSRWPVLRLDHIFCDPADRLADLQVVSTPRARLASDHLPLTAALHR